MIKGNLKFQRLYSPSYPLNNYDKSHKEFQKCTSILYSAMQLPFTVEQFLKVFETYNDSIWPFQIVLYLLAFIAVTVIMMKTKNSGKVAMSILVMLWAWMGLVYHIFYFSAINRAALVFGILFLIQSLIFFHFGVTGDRIQLKSNSRLPGIAALAFVAYALVLYPFISHSTGHTYPGTPTFGVPCPTTIFTFGILLYCVNRIPWYVMLIPYLWTVVGFSAALNLSMHEDFGLVVAGAVFWGIRHFSNPTATTFNLITGYKKITPR